MQKTEEPGKYTDCESGLAGDRRVLALSSSQRGYLSLPRCFVALTPDTRCHGIAHSRNGSGHASL
jgi:hypothetical protein